MPSVAPAVRAAAQAVVRDGVGMAPVAQAVAPAGPVVARVVDPVAGIFTAVRAAVAFVVVRVAGAGVGRMAACGARATGMMAAAFL